MSNRTRRAVRSVVALLIALSVPIGLGVVPSPASADEGIFTTTSITFEGGASYGDPFTLTATVSSEAGVPTGSVTFRDGSGDVMAADVPVVDGVATFETTAPTINLTTYTADFTGTDGWADSSDTEFYSHTRASMVLHPEPTILRLSRSGLKITLTLSAYATRLDGTPVVGEELTFSVFGKQPNLFDFGGGTVICNAVTDAQGFATCSGAGLGGALLSILAGGSYVTHFRSFYEFGSAKSKVIILGGP